MSISFRVSRHQLGQIETVFEGKHDQVIFVYREPVSGAVTALRNPVDFSDLAFGDNYVQEVCLKLANIEAAIVEYDAYGGTIMLTSSAFGAEN